MDTIGKRIKYIASTVGGGNELARQLNISRKTLQSWFTGKTEPKGSQITRIAEISRISPLWILTAKGGAEAIQGRDGEIVERQRIDEFSDNNDSDGENPFIQDPAMVDLMASSRITAQMVEDSVKNLMLYLSQKEVHLNPDALAQTVALICELGASEGKVTMKTVEKLMKFKTSGV